MNNEKKVSKLFALKRGTYSFVLTAIVLAIIIIVNIGVSIVEKKVNLKYDLSKDNSYTISNENVKFLKGIKEPIKIYAIGKESDYAAYLTAYSEQYFNTSPDENMFELTVSLLKKYNNINDNINVEFVDVQSTEYASITKMFPNEQLNIGDILVKSEKANNTKYKHLSFNDIYILTDETGYAAYGYSLYTIDGNRLETVLTSAINYIIPKDAKNVLIYTGHSTNNYSSPYKALLTDNNYTFGENSEIILTEIDKKYDIIVILAPTNDFLPNEIDILKNFIASGKSVLYFASAEAPVLPNLNAMLLDYGISTQDGIMTETNENYMVADTPTAIYSVTTSYSTLTINKGLFVTDYNVPLSASTPKVKGATSNAIASTYSKEVTNGAGEEGKQYDTIIEVAVENGDNTGYLYAFSSVEFISSEWAENSRLLNKDIVIAATDKSAKRNPTVTFVEKKILTDGYTDQVNAAKTTRLRRVLNILSLAIIIVGIVVFIRRRNSK